MNIEEKIKSLDIQLPQPTKPVGAYLACKFAGNLLFISGQVSIDEKGALIKGKLGEDLTTEEGYSAAKRCALSIIAHAKSACSNNLSKIKSCVKLTGYVNSTSTFIEQPKVINGASDLVSSIFGENGMHARAAISTNSLPLGVAVEVDAIFEIF
jgi:enamine deaminase RidA (YjgF/YER057c/UK114 family)